MPVELNIIESVTELDTTVVTVVLESASEPGPAGPGVPSGGTAGQVLTKDSGTDFDTSWQAASGGGVTDADYLVGTAHAGLSAEIVVGTSPGGELGGTWASPTVDATHSGSSHASVQAAAEATAAAALTAHEADTTSVHGIADTSALALTANHPSNATFNDHSARHENGGADEISIAGLDGTSTELAAHLADTADAHDASAISADSTTLVGTGTDVQAVLEELDNGIADHLADGTAAHAASAISFTPNGSIAATDVQAAIQEVRDEAGGGGAPTDATYITQTANGTLSNEQALSALSTGIVKVTTTTGVLSTAVANTDYPAVTHASRHENGGADEISLAGLSGDPADTVNKSLFDANTILAADSDNTPAALTMAASTILARLAAGNIKAASVAEIRTLLDPASWFAFATYTPSLTASSVNPNIGASGTALGLQLAIGKLGIAMVRITFNGAGLAAGTGTFRVSVPWTVHADQPSLTGGVGLVYDSSLSDSHVVLMGPVAGQTYAEMFTAQSASGVNVGNASPVPWAAGDIIVGLIVTAIA